MFVFQITISTLKQIDRKKLDLDINLNCNEVGVNYHIWHAGHNPDLNKDENPLETRIDIDEDILEITKSDGGTETIITPTDCVYIYSDSNHKESYYEDGIDNIDISEDSDMESVDIKPKITKKPVTYKTCTSKKGNYIKKEVKYKRKTAEYDSDYEPDEKDLDIEEPDEYQFDEDELDGEAGFTRRGRKKSKKSKIDTRTYPMECDHVSFL